MSRSDLGESNPELQALRVLVGDWEMELSNAAFLPNRSDTMKGRVSFEWLEHGAFLAMRMALRPPDPPAAVWLISRDGADPNYTAFYYDNRKVSRVYQMSFSDNVWRMWRNALGSSQRFTGRLNPDGDAITAEWEQSTDGATWEHDFDVTYARVSP